MAKKKKVAKPKQEELIHVRMGYNEAIEGKKILLSNQLNALNLAKKIQDYKKIRLEELRKKQAVVKNMKQVKANILKMKKLLPKYETPKIKEELEEEMVKEEVESVKVVKPKNTIESQLEEIQSKLKALG